MKKYVMLIRRVGGWILHVRIFVCLFIHSYLKEILRAKHQLLHYGCPALNCEVRCVHARLVPEKKNKKLACMYEKLYEKLKVLFILVQIYKCLCRVAEVLLAF